MPVPITSKTIPSAQAPRCADGSVLAVGGTLVGSNSFSIFNWPALTFVWMVNIPAGGALAAGLGQSGDVAGAGAGGRSVGAAGAGAGARSGGAGATGDEAAGGGLVCGVPMMINGGSLGWGGGVMTTGGAGGGGKGGKAGRLIAWGGKLTMQST